MSNLKRTFTRYFSEILIIFVGITISFWFENWRAKREEQNDLREVVKSLRVDLSEKKEELLSDIKFIRIHIDELDSCVKLLQSGQCSVALLIDIRRRFDTDHWFFASTTPTFEASANTGTWQLLPDSLKHQIYNLYVGNFGYLEIIVRKQSEYAAGCKADLMGSTQLGGLKAADKTVDRKLCQSARVIGCASLLTDQWEKIIRFQQDAQKALESTDANLEKFLHGI